MTATVATLSVAETAVAVMRAANRSLRVRMNRPKPCSGFGPADSGPGSCRACSGVGGPVGTWEKNDDIVGKYRPRPDLP